MVRILHGAADRPMSLVAPAGSQAALTADLWWFMLALGLAVYVVVMAVLALALWARPGGRFQISDSRRTLLIVVGGLAAPAVILLVLLTADLRTLVAVAAPAGRPDLTIDVVGHQWWWEVRYADQNVATANEVHIPVGSVVLLHVSSVDVIHSFWVPRLAGKMDVLPGQTNTTWLQATEPGEFRGQCAEYCGIQHTNMTFVVDAQPTDQFQAWLAAQQQAAATPTDPTLASGAQAFARLGCIGCHALRYSGTAASGGGLGPDLTHLASRSSIAAGAAPNTADVLARWVTDPNSIKKGTTMPATSTDQQTLQALVSYLQSLK